MRYVITLILFVVAVTSHPRPQTGDAQGCDGPYCLSPRRAEVPSRVYTNPSVQGDVSDEVVQAIIDAANQHGEVVTSITKSVTGPTCPTRTSGPGSCDTCSRTGFRTGGYGAMTWRARRLARIESWGGFRSNFASRRLGRMNARRGY